MGMSSHTAWSPNLFPASDGTDVSNSSNAAGPSSSGGGVGAPPRLPRRKSRKASTPSGSKRGGEEKGGEPSASIVDVTVARLKSQCDGNTRREGDRERDC
mmetsp:Transcript_54017/g.105650  ORF Transcript_54017/g.105650 Transcript_54017/m.105650 type:complete len:100 (-) Transcript_54017:112-411(-)